MFASKELREIRDTVEYKYEIYKDHHRLYYLFSITYIKIAKTVCKACSQKTLEEIRFHYCVDYQYGYDINNGLQMPLLLNNGSVLTFDVPFSAPQNNMFSRSDFPEKIYIDDELKWVRHSGGKTYDTYEDYVIQEEFEEKRKPISRQISDLYAEKSKLMFFQRKQKAALQQLIDELSAQDRELWQAELPYFTKDISMDEVFRQIDRDYGIPRTEKPKRESKPKAPERVKIQKRGFSDEADEIRYLQEMNTWLDREIAGFRAYVIKEDDPYIAYLAQREGLSGKELMEKCFREITVYQRWRQMAYPDYFAYREKRDAEIANDDSERRRRRARFVANVFSFGEYHVYKDDTVYGTAGLVDLVAGNVSDKYGRIEKKRIKELNDYEKRRQERWERLGL